MIKKLLTVAALALVLSSCTADKFEQIDANFALLVEENERINDAIDSNSDDITSLEEALDDAVEYLEDLVEDATEALTEVIDTLSEDTTNVLNQLVDADASLANDLQNASDNLSSSIEDLQNQVDTQINDINNTLEIQEAINAEYGGDLLALQVALETATGDAAANLETAIAALIVERDIEFNEFNVKINTLLAGIPAEVRSEVSDALLAISFNASNVLEIQVVNPTDDLLAVEANIIALQLQITQLLAAGSGTAVDISALQNADGSVALTVGTNVYTIPAGAQGAAGIRGLVGLTGAVGSQGAIGAQGIQGLQGDIGNTGSAGATGTIGLTGLTGAQGNIGLTGSAGATGTIGAIGAQGIQGVAGNNGIGTQGAQGIQGLVGNTGSAGATGAIGLQGIQGLQGAIGMSGSQGATGTIGIPGVTGMDGTTPVISVRTETDGKVFITVNGVDYLIVDPPATPDDGWVNSPLGGGGDQWVFEIPNDDDYYQIQNPDSQPTVFRLVFVSPGNPIATVGTYSSLVNAKEGARAHMIANP